MKKKLIFLAAVMMTGVIALAVHAEQAATLGPDKVPRMSIDDLKRQMTDNPNLVIIDVRASHDWEESKTRVRGAVREDPSKMGSWIDKYPPGKTIVLYCK